MNFISIIFAVIILILTAMFPDICALAVRKGIYLCIFRAVPALFPFFAASSLAVNSGFCSSLSKLFSKPFNNLGLPSCTPSVFFLSIIGGYPIGAATIQSMIKNGYCSKKESEKLILFCNNTGPAFFIGMCGEGILHSLRAGIFLYIIHVTSALLIMLLNKSNSKMSSNNKMPDFNYQPFFQCFTKSITQAGRSCFSIVCFILYFSVLIELMNPLISQFHGVFPIIITGFLELTSGLSSLRALSLPNILCVCICSGMCAFGGLSVIFQCACAAPDCSFSRIFIGKVIHCALAVLLCFLFFPLSGL